MNRRGFTIENDSLRVILLMFTSKSITNWFAE